MVVQNMECEDRQKIAHASKEEQNETKVDGTSLYDANFAAYLTYVYQQSLAENLLVNSDKHSQKIFNKQSLIKTFNDIKTQSFVNKETSSCGYSPSAVPEDLRIDKKKKNDFNFQNTSQNNINNPINLSTSPYPSNQFLSDNNSHFDQTLYSTQEIAKMIASELRRYGIPQAVFSERVLGRSQGTLSDLLRNPKPWNKLKAGKETFRRMLEWLNQSETQRLQLLKTDQQIKSEKPRRTHNGSPHSSSPITTCRSRNSPCKKPRLVFTEIQRRTLNAIFKEVRRPSRDVQITIAQQLNLKLSTVSNFFMNARRRSIEKFADHKNNTSFNGSHEHTNVEDNVYKAFHVSPSGHKAHNGDSFNTQNLFMKPHLGDVTNDASHQSNDDFNHNDNNDHNNNESDCNDDINNSLNTINDSYDNDDFNNSDGDDDDDDDTTVASTEFHSFHNHCDDNNDKHNGDDGMPYGKDSDNDDGGSAYNDATDCHVGVVKLQNGPPSSESVLLNNSIKIMNNNNYINNNKIS